MGIKPELSENSKYWIERHRYYELQHFCLQYPIWKKAYHAISGLSAGKPLDGTPISKTNAVCDPVAKCVEARMFYAERMELIERIAQETDPGIASYILEAVTEGISYDVLKVRRNIPCCRDVYYNLYRRFFWLLNKARD